MATNSTSSRGGTVAITLILLFDLIAASFVGLFFSPSSRLWVWIGTLVLLVIFILAVGKVITNSWFGVLIDNRRKMSLSRFQTVLWTVLILSAFQAAALTNIQLVSNPTDALTINIPPEILAILGISVTSLVGKSVILSSKSQKVARKNPDSEDPTNREPSWIDMFNGDDKANAGFVDLSKVQMFYFTIILVLVYGVALASMFMVVDPKHSAITALPALTPSIVGLLGISQGGYLVYKGIPRGQTNGESPTADSPAAPPIQVPAVVDQPPPAPPIQAPAVVDQPPPPAPPIQAPAVVDQPPPPTPPIQVPAVVDQPPTLHRSRSRCGYSMNVQGALSIAMQNKASLYAK